MTLLSACQTCALRSGHRGGACRDVRHADVGISRDVHGGLPRKRPQAYRHRGAFALASALVLRETRSGRLDERYHEGLLRSGAPVLAHYAADFRHGRFDAGIRRYDVRVRLEAGGICSLAHSRGVQRCF